MQTTRTRVWGILLAFIMLLTILPTTVLAADDSGQGGNEPAPAADTSTIDVNSFKSANSSAYSVAVTYNSEGGYYEATFSTTAGTALDETVSGSGEGASGTHGFWVGLTLTTPEDATAYVWDYSGRASREGVAGALKSGRPTACQSPADNTFNWYLNAGSVNRGNSWVGVQFYSGESNSYEKLGDPIYIHMTFTDVKLDADATYTVDDKTGYASLAQAIEKVENGGTVKLLANVDLTDGVEVDKKLTLDLNGYTISGSTNEWTRDPLVDYLVAVKRGGDLTIEDSSAAKTGAITTETIMCGVKMTVSGETDSTTPAKLTVNGGTIQGYQYGISGQGTRHNTEITINGGTIRSFAPAKDNAQNIDSIAIYQPQDGTLTINGGTIQSPNTAIEIRSGRLTVTGGTITGGSGEPASTSNGSGGTTTNTGIAIAQHTTGKPIVVTITGGEITGGAAVYESDPNSIYESNPSAEKPSISVSDGTFTGQISAANVEKFIAGGTFTDDSASNFLDDGCALDNGNVIPAPDSKVVIGSKGYTSLTDAIDEAKAGDTIELRDNVNTDTTIFLPAGVTLDGNGHEITYTGTRNDSTKPNDGAFITAESGADNVTIQDVTINAGENIKHGVQFYCSDNGTLSNVTVNGGAWTSVMVNGATGVTIKDSELNPLGNAAYATIEYGMGTGVTTIPSFTLNNVTTSDPDGVKVWADNDTVKKGG